MTGFAAVLGHAAVAEALRAAARQQRLAHAMIFAGPSGVGKRSLALAFAAWMQCEAAGDDACGRCVRCAQVAAGTHPDVQVIAVAAGKKEIGVDRARELKRFVQLRPVAGRAKIAVIDEAHLLSLAAQNALLKTLEEPAPRSVLILIAHNPDALLATVRSRCRRVPFAPLPDDLVLQIVGTHGVDAPTAREAVALAEGSVGRALLLAASFPLAERQQLAAQLAGLREAGYVRVMQLASELGRPEPQVPLKLELLLSHYRDAAAHAIAMGESPAPALHAADAVQDAWTALRRTNPNRQLLLESLLLRLADS